MIFLISILYFSAKLGKIKELLDQMLHFVVVVQKASVLVVVPPFLSFFSFIVILGGSMFRM